MHPLSLPILIILLLIPNTTWHDWRTANAPHFQALLQSSSIALMNDRTAETDQITRDAGLQSILAGARMRASGDTSHLGYPALSGNLVAGLQQQYGPALKAFQIMDTPDNRTYLVLPRAQRPELAIESTELGWRKVDAFIQSFQDDSPDTNTLLVVASTNPSPDEYARGDQLTPVAIWQHGITPGLLYSKSTRHAGLVTNTDIAPTIAALANVTLPAPVYGSACATISMSPDRALSALDNITSASLEQNREQHAVPYIAAAIAILIGLVSLMPVTYRKPAAILAAIVSCLPLALAFAPNIATACFIATLSCAALTYSTLSQHRRMTEYVSLTICLLAVALPLIDATLLHARLTSAALLGYTPAEGARYYGLGNEAMGIMVGGAAVLTARLRRSATWFGAVLWLGLGACLGAPSIGAKAGGVLVCAVCLVAYLIVNVGNKRISGGTVALALLAVIGLGVGGLYAIAHGHNNHVSRLFDQERAYGTTIFTATALRKIGMDLHLMLHSVWFAVLICCAIGYWLTERNDRQRDADRRLTRLGVVATLACLVLNDAGVVAAALCAIFLWSHRLTLVASKAKASRMPNATLGLQKASTSYESV